MSSKMSHSYGYSFHKCEMGILTVDGSDGVEAADADDDDEDDDEDNEERSEDAEDDDEDAAVEVAFVT
jgi:phosphopantothenoylcysteine synthetase/decarboxylase